MLLKVPYSTGNMNDVFIKRYKIHLKFNMDVVDEIPIWW